MKILHRKLIRDLWRSKWLLLAITSIIAIGVMTFVSMLSVYFNLEDAKHDYYTQCRMADFWVDAKKVPRAELTELAQGEGIAELLPRIGFHAIVDLPDLDKPINALVVSLPDRRTTHANGIVLRSGSYFTPRQANEAIVTTAFARAHNLQPGRSIHVLLNNRRQELQIVGTGISSEFTYLLGPGEIVPNPKSFGVLYIKHSFAEEVFDMQAAANQLVGRLSPAGKRIEPDVLRHLEARLEPFGVSNVTPLRLQASNQFLSHEIAGLGTFALILPAIFLVVASLVLNVLLNRLARQQRTIIGTLKAIGYGDGAILRHFLGFGMVVGAIGGILGSILGQSAATGMTALYTQFFEFPNLYSRFQMLPHAIGMAISLACAIIGSLHGARAMWRLNAAEAMRPERPRGARAIWLERWIPELWQRLSSGWRVALRNVFRARFRSAAGVFAAAMGASLLVNGFMMVKAQTFMIDFQFDRMLRSDVEITFFSEHNRDALREVRQLPGIDRAEPVWNVACTLVHGPYARKGGITGITPDATLTVPADERGRRVPLPDAGLVLTQRLAEILHVQPGDQLTVIPTKGQRWPIAMTVSQVSDSFLGLAAYADLRFLARALGEDEVLTGVQLQLNGDPRALRTLYREIKRKPGVATVRLRHDTVDNLKDQVLKSQWIFIVMLIGFAGVLFCGSILNASMVSLAERQREVATLIALGYSRLQIGAMFLRESLMINLAGTLLGMPIGYWLTVLIAVLYNNDLIRLPVVTAWWIWWSTFGLAVLFALFAHAAVQRRIQRLAFVEVLQVKE